MFNTQAYPKEDKDLKPIGSVYDDSIVRYSHSRQYMVMYNSLWPKVDYCTSIGCYQSNDNFKLAHFINDSDFYYDTTNALISYEGTQGTVTKELDSLLLNKSRSGKQFGAFVSNSHYQSDKYNRYVQKKYNITSFEKLGILSIKEAKKHRYVSHFCKEKLKFYGFKGNMICSPLIPLKLYHIKKYFKNDLEEYNNLLFQTNVSERDEKYTIKLINKFNNLKSRELGVIFSYSLISNILDKYKSRESLNSSLNYHFKKYGTKKLSSLVFTSHSKVIIRLIKHCVNDSQDVEYLYKFFSSPLYKEQELVRAVQAFDIKSYEFSHLLLLYMIAVYGGVKSPIERVLKLENIGNFSEIFDDLDTVINVYNRALNHEDGVEILKTLAVKTKGYIDGKTDHVNYNRELVRLLQQVKNVKVNFEYSQETIDTFNFSDDDVVISLAQDSSELLSMGSEMNICVGSYVDRVKTKRCDILSVKSAIDNNYLVCIELRGKSIVQAKMAYNNRLVNDKDLLLKIQNYAAERSIGINTYDMETHTNGTTDHYF